MDGDLIYDVGLHKGEDTEFYLNKGFRVVAVEANPDMCELVEKRLAQHVSSGRLTIVRAALVEEPGPTTFYTFDMTAEWGTARPELVERNERMGAKAEEITVAGVRFESILQEFGVPYFIKIDIEGNDTLCLKALLKQDTVPQYLSIESDKASWSRLRREFRLLKQLRYRRFKVVNQLDVPRQKPPRPAREGTFVDQDFKHGASGLFGREAPGVWLPAWCALLVYRWVFFKYWLVGNDGIIENLHRRKAFRNRPRLRRLLHPGWYDTHASL